MKFTKIMEFLLGIVIGILLSGLFLSAIFVWFIVKLMQNYLKEHEIRIGEKIEDLFYVGTN